MRLFAIILLTWLCLFKPGSTEAQYPNIRVSREWSLDPEEVTIAINPADPMNLAAGAYRAAGKCLLLK